MCLPGRHRPHPATITANTENHRRVAGKDAAVLSALLLLPCLLFPSGLSAGSATILGQSDAVHCYLASRTGSLDGEQACEAAIRGGELTRRELAATLSNRGILRARRGALTGALEDHTAALQLMPALAGARVNRGNVYYRLRQYEQALADYEAAAELQPLGRSWLNAGITLLQLRQPARAVAALERALALAPDSPAAANLLARARELLRDAEDNSGSSPGNNSGNN